MNDKHPNNHLVNPLASEEMGLLEENLNTLRKAIEFARNLLSGHRYQTGELTLSHADSVCKIIENMGGSIEIRSAIYLAYACGVLSKPYETIHQNFDKNLTELAISCQKILEIEKLTINITNSKFNSQSQIEHVRGLLLTFSKDLRVIMVLLASQMQTIRYITSEKIKGFEAIASNIQNIYSPLASRLGIWQIKWELEDLAFRVLEPNVYKNIAGLLEIKRVDREIEITEIKQRLDHIFISQKLHVKIHGRPKNIYSIVKKMRGKSLEFNQLYDLRAIRIITDEVADCYRCLSIVHQHLEPLDNQFDDYIAKPKSNGYQSLHTVVRDTNKRIFEIQIRTQTMHAHAEFGVASHWAYKENGVKGYAGFFVETNKAQRIAVLRQLLAWERDVSVDVQKNNQHLSVIENEKIYVFTPEASIVELCQGSTPIDFAYAVHTELGHRCRGAKVEGILVPLSTPLLNGQSVEILTAKDGGPSLDWLNPDLRFIRSPRSKSKVRAWFNYQKSQETISRGRLAVEKLLQREGKTALNLDELAKQLGYETSSLLFEVVGKDEFSLRQIESLWRPMPEIDSDDEKFLKKFQNTKSNVSKGSVLVVGVDSLLTQLAKCCRPVPPDPIKGYVTKGKGISVHRLTCHNFSQLQQREPERSIAVEWKNKNISDANDIYFIDVQVIADDRQGLLKDISEVFSREKINVVGVKTQTIKDLAYMTFTVEAIKSSGIHKILSMLLLINGVRIARRP